MGIIQSPIPVVFDLSYLGMILRRPSTFGGIARVSAQIASGLAQRDDLDVNFYAGEFLPELLDYGKNHEPILARLIRPRFLGANANRLLAKTGRFVEQSVDNRSVVMRASRWFLARANKPFRSYQSRIARNTFGKRFIYHSPLDPVPGRLGKDVVKFITIYDLTTRLFPEFTTPQIISRLERVFSSLDKDYHCLCISEQTRRDLIAHCDVDPKRCFVTYLAASEIFRPCQDEAQVDAVKRKYSIPSKYFLSLSMLEPRKNIPTVIRAFARRLERGPSSDVSLVLVGGKGWKTEGIFNEAAANRKCRDRIILTGHVPDEELSAIYSGALAFLYMSFYEGFGLPVLEAMQCGLPVIASNTSSLPEVVGNAGIMLNPTDEEGVADAMLKIESDDTLRTRLRELGLNQAKRFTWEKCLDETVAAYRKAFKRFS